MTGSKARRGKRFAGLLALPDRRHRPADAINPSRKLAFIRHFRRESWGLSGDKALFSGFFQMELSENRMHEHTI
jgi:hypothetical protein